MFPFQCRPRPAIPPQSTDVECVSACRPLRCDRGRDAATLTLNGADYRGDGARAVCRAVRARVCAGVERESAIKLRDMFALLGAQFVSTMNNV